MKEFADIDILHDNNNLTVLLLGEELLDGCEHQRSGVNGERSLSVKCVSDSRFRASVCVSVCECVCVCVSESASECERE